MAGGIQKARGVGACEECEATGARPTRVTFVDQRQSTLRLCENCVTRFEAAVLVETANAVEAA